MIFRLLFSWGAKQLQLRNLSRNPDPQSKGTIKEGIWSRKGARMRAKARNLTLEAVVIYGM